MDPTPADPTDTLNGSTGDHGCLAKRDGNDVRSLGSTDGGSRKWRPFLFRRPPELKTWFSTGSSLPDDVWAQRHRWILALLWLHIPGIFIFALVRHVPAGHGALEASIVGIFAVTATMATLVPDNRRLSTVLTSMGLMVSSAVLVHLANGSIEMHFHYFVMVGVVTLYQDWLPFLVAIGFVVLHHGIMGAIDPGSVYSHGPRVGYPWEWAGIHGGFILAMSLKSESLSWRLNESLQRRALDRELAFARTTLAPTPRPFRLKRLTTLLVVDLEGRLSRPCPPERFVELWRVPDAILEGATTALRWASC